MVETKTRLFPRITAYRIIKAYADLYELGDYECRNIGVEQSCEDLKSVLNGNGYITADERSSLIAKGYSERFVSALFGKDGARARNKRISSLIRYLKWRKNSDKRKNAAAELGKIGPAAKKAVSALIKVLNDEDECVRDAAAEALGKIGAAAKEAIPALIEALKEKSESPGAMIALKGIGEVAIPALIEALKHKNQTVRRNAAQTLGRIGPEAKEAIPALVIALRDKSNNEDVRRDAACSLGNIGPETTDVVPALISALNDQSSSVRCDAAWALGKIGPAAKEAIPALKVALEDVDKYVRQSAEWALKDIEESW